MPLTNSQYNTIMRDYEQTRSKNRLEEDRRRQEVYERIPAFEDLDLSVPSLGASTAIDVIKKNVSVAEALGTALTEIEIKKRALLLEHSFPEDYLDPVYTCKDCKDTGYQDDKRCHCFEKKTRDFLYTQSNLSELIKTNNFGLMREDFYQGEELSRFKGAVDICRQFISSFKTDSSVSNILFFGTVGSGKSFLSIATAKELLDKGMSVLYFSAIDLFERLSFVTFNGSDADEKKTLYHDLLSSDLLIIDDLGTELTNSFVSTQLFNLINERQLHHVSTIISTNFDLEGLRARYSDRVFSRLVGQYTICELTGRDIRITGVM